MGLTRWELNPTFSDLRRSSSCPQPVSATKRNVPDFLPALAHRTAQTPWVLVTQHRAVGVVIDTDVL